MLNEHVPTNSVATSNNGRIHTIPRQNLEAKQLFQLLSREDGQVFEIRGVNAMLKTDKKPYDKPRIISGYFDDADTLATAITAFDDTSEGVYITINPCKEGTFSRAANRLNGEKGLSTTADAEIEKRQILFLDCDPEREGGIRKIPTNDSEHQAALDFIEHLAAQLDLLGWPAPIEIDSGNGGYLVYAIDLPADDDGLIQRVLAGLDKKFSTEQVHIDLTAFNQARIMRVPRTWNCKADSTKKRPHRQARIISVPETFEVVSREQLEEVAAPVEQEPEKVTPTVRVNSSSAGSANGTQKANAPLTSPEDFLNRNNIRYAPMKTDRFGKKIWVLLDGCVFNSQHVGKDAAVTQLPDGTYGYNCFHDHCAKATWTDFAKHVEPGYMTSEEKNAAYEAAQAAKKDTKPKKDDTPDEKKEKEPNQTQVLLQICRRAKYFKTPEGDLCANVPINSHRETVVIGEKGGFRMWLISRYYEQTGNAANTTAVQQAIEIVAATTNESAPVEELFTRVGRKNGKIYLDTANAKHQVIEIDANDWRVLDISPVHFRRPSGMLPLPIPKRGGNLEKLLRPFLNLNPKNPETGNDADWHMIVGYILMLLHPTGPYPVLALGGEQGATKSSTARFIRGTIDPNIAMSRPVPKEERDMAIAARSNWIISFENLSHIPDWLSDAMCRMSTGAGYGTRALWENDKEAVFANKRPQIVNGISDLITKSDLLSRTISVGLPVMDKSKYKTEAILNAEFEAAHPFILGAILDAISSALRNLPNITAQSSTRMVEMEMWIRAAEPALGWKAGTFTASFADNQDKGIDVVLEASQVAKAIMAFMEERGYSWMGNSTMLYNQLKTVMGNELDYKSWPANPKTLSDAIKKLAPALRARKIQVIHKRTNGKRLLELSFSAADSAAETPNSDADHPSVTQDNSPAALPDTTNQAENGLNSAASDAENTTLSNPDIFQNREIEGKRELIEERGNSASLAALSTEIDTENQPITCAVCHIPIEETEDFQFDNDGIGYCSGCWQQMNS